MRPRHAEFLEHTDLGVQAGERVSSPRNDVCRSTRKMINTAVHSAGPREPYCRGITMNRRVLFPQTRYPCYSQANRTSSRNELLSRRTSREHLSGCSSARNEEAAHPAGNAIGGSPVDQ